MEEEVRRVAGLLEGERQFQKVVGNWRFHCRKEAILRVL
jgi:hypothetical protein